MVHLRLGYFFFICQKYKKTSVVRIVIKRKMANLVLYIQ